ncbi:MAG TPA: HlyD family efflux transporter periplasmic adaptor subunit [Lacunisphaera sp.]|nr:HlyD family efflux transporter periplasmic adaptor subunit [Lacunisphaera sp.]
MNGNATILIPAEMGVDTVESLLAEHGRQFPWTYWLVLAGASAGLASLPLLKVDISVRAAGLVRPVMERTELRPAVSGHIAEVLARDNDRVRAGQALLLLRSRDVEERLARNQRLQAEARDLIADLETLTTGIHMPPAEPAGNSQAREETTGPLSLPPPPHGVPVVKTLFRTAALRRDQAGVLAQLASYRLAESKARGELDRYTQLSAKGIATRQEFDNARYEVDRLAAETRLLEAQVLARWQARLREETTTLAGLVSEAQRLHEELAQYAVRAPTDGVLVGFRGLSPGGFVAAGDTLGEVSPEGGLMVDTYVSPHDIGLIHVGQPVRLQVDAYPYTQWGLLDGTVTAIGGDLLNRGGGGPEANAFEVIVRPHATALLLSNGVRGELKKGLTLTARFLVARRSILQLLYDDADAWLNPQGNASAT